MDIVGISCKACHVYVPCAYAHKQPHNRYMVMPVFNPSTEEEKEEEEDLCEFYANLAYIASSRTAKKSKYSSRNKSNKRSERKTCTMSIKTLNRVKKH